MGHRWADAQAKTQSQTFSVLQRLHSVGVGSIRHGAVLLVEGVHVWLEERLDVAVVGGTW